jgi:dihydrofolate reductase
MRKLILYSAASIDNFIARAGGETDWLDSQEYLIPEEDFGYKEFYDSIDTILMGNNTYKQLLSFNLPFPYQDKKNYVFSHTESNKDNEYVEFISGDITAFVQNLKKGEGPNIWLVGGGQINTYLLNNNLIDKLILTVIPVILGSGIALFAGNSPIQKFHLSSARPFSNGFVQLVYER